MTVMEEATPRRKDLRRVSMLNTSVASSPLRRSNIGPENSALISGVDDEEERNKRRKDVAIQRRLTNISAQSGSPMLESMKESEIKDHLMICTKLFIENRISAKNAWQLKVIDAVGKIVSMGQDNVLQVAVSSLDVGAKVYGLRVDDVHSKALELAGTLATNEQKPVEEEQEANEGDVTLNQPRKKTKAKRKLNADKRTIIDTEGKSLFETMDYEGAVIFDTKENIDVGASENLFTEKLTANNNNHLMLMSEEKIWSVERDKILDVADNVLEIDFPDIKLFNICVPFKDFETGNWDPKEEERLLAESHVVLDENNLPIAELDGSVADIFADDNGPPISDEEDNFQENFEVQTHGDIAPIGDAVPEASRTETEYGYNSLVRTSSGKYLERLWAGPMHWKVKFNRRSAGRYSGSVQHHVVRQTRRAKVAQLIAFVAQVEEGGVRRYKGKRAPPTSTFDKVTLPIPEEELCIQKFHQMRSEFMMRPGVAKPYARKRNGGCQNLEVQNYDYDNPNDSLYCSQLNNDDGHDDDAGALKNSFEEEIPAAAQLQEFGNNNLIEMPEMAAVIQIPYAMQAKKMDMKKLKAAVWKTVAVDNTVKPLKFSELYQAIPPLLNADMRKELSCPLAVIALLHLCNDHNLLLKQQDKDFLITQAVE